MALLPQCPAERNVVQTYAELKLRKTQAREDAGSIAPLPRTDIA